MTVHELFVCHAPTSHHLVRAEGIGQADYIIAKRDGKAKVLQFPVSIDNTLAIQITNGFTSEIDKCSELLGEGRGHPHCRTTAHQSGFSRKTSTALLGRRRG